MLPLELSTTVPKEDYGGIRTLGLSGSLVLFWLLDDWRNGKI